MTWLAALTFGHRLLIGSLAVSIALGLPLAHWRGERVGRAKQKLDDDARSAAALAVASERYRAKEVAHAEQVSTLRLDFARREASARALDEARARELASGARRVRLPVARCGPAATAPGAAPSGVDGAGSAELPGEVAAALDGIACACDKYARQVTGLQEWARAAVRLCNGGLP